MKKYIHIGVVLFITAIAYFGVSYLRQPQIDEQTTDYGQEQEMVGADATQTLLNQWKVTNGILQPRTATNTQVTNLNITGTCTGDCGGGGGGSASSTYITVCASGCDYTATTTSGTTGNAQVGINAAIAAASASVNTKTVYIKGSGTSTPYVISDALQLKPNVTILGDGIDVTVIKAQDAYATSTNPFSASGRIMVTNATDTPLPNITIKGITFDANVQNIPGLTSNTHHRTIWIQRATNFRFEQNKVLNTINWAVYFQYSDQVWIDRNIILGGFSSTYDQNDGFHLRNSKNVYITNNFINTNSGGTSGDDAIAILTDSNATEAMTNVQIIGNVISSYSRGIFLGTASGYDLTNTNVSDNIIWYAEKSGIQLQRIGSTLTSIFNDITVHNNKISDFGNGSQGAGISIDHSIGSASFVTFKNLKVTDNTIRDGNYTTYLGSGILVIAKTTGLVIQGNKMSDLVGTAGITLGEVGVDSRPIIDGIVTGNEVNVSTGASGAVGINAYGTQRTVISNNLITGTTTGTTYGIALRAKATAGNDANGIPNIETSSYNNIHGNQIYNFDNGIAELNSGADPDNNTYQNNQFNTVTTEYTILGASSGFTHLSGKNLGIGTTTPSNMVEIVNSGTNGLRVWNSTPSASANTGAGIIGQNLTVPDTVDDRLGFVLFGSGGNTSVGMAALASEVWTVGSAQGSYLDLQTTLNGTTNRATKLRVTNDGRVGIGSTTPQGILTVAGFNTGGNTTTPLFILASSTNATLFQVGSNGRVGIGDFSSPTTTIGNALEIVQSGTNGLRIWNSFSSSANTGAGILLQNLQPPSATGHRLGFIFFGADAQSSAGLNAFSENAWTSTSRGSYLTFQTSAINTTSRIERLRITASGLIGIGTTSPIATLSVQGTSTLPTTAAFVVASSSNAVMFNVLSNGNVGVNTSTPNAKFAVAADCSAFASAVSGRCTDLAEIYSSSQPVEMGEIVSIDGGDALVKKSSGVYDNRMIGIVSTKPAIVIEGDAVEFMNGADYNFDPVRPAIALAGRVPVRVTGNVRAGDFVTSSDQPGIGMKATRSGQVIGQALSDSENGVVMVFVNPGYQGFGEGQDIPISQLGLIGLLGLLGLLGFVSLLRRYKE